jgi:recombinational DNA repair ATPase RecF
VAGRKLALFSSGEKKKYLLMLYMAYVEMFRQARGEYPVLLIDDFDAAMDERNLDFLMGHFPAMQLIATSVAENKRFASRLELAKEN